VRGGELVASRPVCFTPDETAYSVLGEEALGKKVKILTFLSLKKTLRNMNTFYVINNTSHNIKTATQICYYAYRMQHETGGGL